MVKRLVSAQVTSLLHCNSQVKLTNDAAMKKIVFGMLLLAALVCVYRVYDAHNFTYREKLTVTFETPEGVVEASSVIERRAWESYVNIAQTGGRYWDKTGEAVVVNLAPERYLFVLRGRPKLIDVMATLKIVSGGVELENQSEIRNQLSPIRVPRDWMPKMVMFGDIDDPTSLAVVEPEELTTTFGEGYALKSVTMQATDEPVTEGLVMELLPWLEARGREHASVKGRPQGGQMSEHPDAEVYQISPSDFTTELYK